MSKRHRRDGQAFTCSNRWFETNVAKEEGYPHGPGQAGGSVFPEALITTEKGYSLWLAHVTDKREGPDTFWLMWYDPDGSPTIPFSAVINAAEIQEIARGLASFIRMP